MTNETHIKGDLVQGNKFDGDKIEGDKHDHHHYLPPQFPLDNLPPPNPNFTGRVELLDRIQTRFTQPSNPNQQSSIVITQAIAGLGGVGKTQVALAYAHAHRDEYDLIWQIRADNAAALDADLRGLGTVLRLPVQNADTSTARQMVLSQLNGAAWRWLLLYDNADQMSARDLRPYLPGGRGHVLITSRRPDWPRAQRIRLDVFTAEEAAAFWRRRLERELEEDGALAELAEELGYLPLALEQAAAYMEKRQKSAAAYLALYRERRQEVWARETPPDDYHATVTTTWEMAFEYARQTPGAADLLNLCCFLAPDDMPLDIIAGNTAALPAELAAVAGDEMALEDALDALQAYSLLRRDNGVLAMHRLVQTVARDWMGEERSKIWAKAAVNLTLAAWPFRQYEADTWADSVPLLPHLQAAADWAEAFHIDTTDAANLSSHIVFYLNFFGDSALAQPHAERALEISERVLGPDHPDTARSLNNLGFLLQAMGELAAARPYYERALAILEAKLGPDHPTTKIVCGNLQSLE